MERDKEEVKCEREHEMNRKAQLETEEEGRQTKEQERNLKGSGNP